MAHFLQIHCYLQSICICGPQAPVSCFFSTFLVGSVCTTCRGWRRHWPSVRRRHCPRQRYFQRAFSLTFPLEVIVHWRGTEFCEKISCNSCRTSGDSLRHDSSTGGKETCAKRSKNSRLTSWASIGPESHCGHRVHDTVHAVNNSFRYMSITTDMNIRIKVLIQISLFTKNSYIDSYIYVYIRKIYTDMYMYHYWYVSKTLLLFTYIPIYTHLYLLVSKYAYF